MSAYWLTFRIRDDDGYEAAYNKLINAIKECVDGEWWFETTSFYTFQSEMAAGAIATHLKAAIRPDRDLVVLGMPDFKTGRVIGHCADQDLFKIIPFMKKV
jgi:hypothetical protein